MEFKFMSFDQKSKLFDDYLRDYSSSSPADPRRFLSLHPELLNEDAAIFALEKAKSKWIAAQNSDMTMDSLRCGVTALTISKAIKMDHLCFKAADFLAAKNYRVGDMSSSVEWDIEAKKYDNCKLLSCEKKTNLITPFIDLINTPRNFEYLHTHSELLNEEVVQWALDLAIAYCRAYPYINQADKRELFIKSALNLGNVAYSIGGEIKNFELAAQASDLIGNLVKEVGGSNANPDLFRRTANDLRKKK